MTDKIFTPEEIAIEEEARDRSVLEKMRDASIEKFITKFGKGAVISEMEFLL